MNKFKNFVWMPLIGFDAKKEDKGVEEFLSNTGFVPEGISLFLFHSDIVNQHEGMEKEFILHPDNCSYYGVPRNEFRERQEWTNYDLRTLARGLSCKGIDTYLGIMGVYLENTRHQEWESDYPELLSIGCNGRMNLNVLKRFKDGTFYEDFFIKKVVDVLDDYGFTGLHVSDFFCPPEHSICNGDFSTDMLEQFIEYSGIILPESILCRMGYDEHADIIVRKDYIWNSLRREWIEFYVWRWEKFWGKVSFALHKRDKKVMINNAWASDPFEAMYRYGIDYQKLSAAGVDYFVAETVPEGAELVDNTGDLFRQYMSMAHMMSVFMPKGKVLSLLGVKDCTEEWDMLHHAPTRLERDIYTLASLYYHKENKLCNSMQGYMITLGDGIVKDEWEWLQKRFDIALSDTPKSIAAATVIWSDKAHYGLLDEYIHNRRPSTHKLVYDLLNRNGALGASARIEDIDSLEGPLFVPNFDLLPENEQEIIMSYKKGAVICIASSDFMSKNTQIVYDISFEDKYAPYKLCAFAFGITNFDEEIKIKINECLQCKAEIIDNTEIPMLWQDASFFTTPMIFRKMSEAFLNACVVLLDSSGVSIFSADVPLMPQVMEDGTYRLYVFNRDKIYKRAEIYSKKRIVSVRNVSMYPVLPVKMIYKATSDQKLDGAKGHLMNYAPKCDEIPCGFIAKIPPFGVSIFDIEVE